MRRKFKVLASSKDNRNHNTDNRIAYGNEIYRGYLIRMDRKGEFFNVYDKQRELEDYGFKSIKDARTFVDSLLEEDVTASYKNPTSQILQKGAIEYNGYYIVEDIAGDGYDVYDENFSLVDEGYGSLGSAKEFIEQLVESDPERIHCATEDDETQYNADMANGIQDIEQQGIEGEQSVDDDDKCYRHRTTNRNYSGYQLKHLFKFKEYHGYTGTYEEWLQGQLDSGKLVECSMEDVEASDWDGYASYDEWRTAIPDYPEDEEEFEDAESSGFWYFTRHGVQPGSIPRRASVLDMIDTPNGTYVKLDCVLNTKELNEYDMKEQAPPSDVMSSIDETSWDDMSWEQQIQKMKSFVKAYRGTRVFEDFAESIGVDVEDVIDSFSDAEAHGDLKVPQSKQRDSDYSNDDIYTSDVVSANIPDYGGAFDVEPEQYFTREEINEVGGEVCERLKPLFNSEFKVTDLYMDDKGDNNLTMEIESLATGEVFFANVKIDRRCGKNPRAMLLKAVKVLVDKFENAINQTSFELSSNVDASQAVESTEITSTDEIQYGVHQFSTESIIFRGTDEECGKYIDERPELWDDAEVYMMTPDDPHYVKSSVYHVRKPEAKRYNEDASEEYVETHLDAVILMDENGSWTYEDESYPWARSEEDKEGNWYANEHSNVKIADPIDVVEKVDELLVPLLPEDPGRYHIQGSVTLTFNLSGIEYDETFYGWTEDEGNVVDRDYYTDDAEVEFISDKSSIDHFEWKMVGPGEEVDVQAQQDVEAVDSLDGLAFSSWTVAEGPHATSANGYDNWTLLEKVGNGITPRYSLYDNNIESLDQAGQYTFHLSKISPYDNTEYVWCTYKGGMANYYDEGRRCFSEAFICDEDKYEEVAEWQNEVIERCLARLESFNSRRKARIDHS